MLDPCCGFLKICDATRRDFGAFFFLFFWQKITRIGEIVQRTLAQ